MEAGSGGGQGGRSTDVPGEQSLGSVRLVTQNAACRSLENLSLEMVQLQAVDGSTLAVCRREGEPGRPPLNLGVDFSALEEGWATHSPGLWSAPSCFPLVKKTPLSTLTSPGADLHSNLCICESCLLLPPGENNSSLEGRVSEQASGHSQREEMSGRTPAD